MISLDKLNSVSGMSLKELELRDKITPPGSDTKPGKAMREELEEDERGLETEAFGQLGPTDMWGMPVKYAYRRAFSDVELMESFGYGEFREGWCYNFMSRGDVDLSSFLKLILRQQNVKHLIVSSWRADLSDFEMLCKWKEAGKIGRLDVYLGRQYAYGSERRYNIRTFRDRLDKFDDASVKVFKNHSRLLVGKGYKFNFAVLSSANLNMNINAENFTVIIDKDCFDFYLNFFKDVRTLI